MLLFTKIIATIKNQFIYKYLVILLFKSLIVLLFFLHINSCNYFNNTSKKGSFNTDSIISHEDMIDMLVDIHIIEAAIYLNQLQNKDVDFYSTQYYTMFLKKYNISAEQIKYSIDYYMHNTDEYDIIYNEVMNILMQMQSLLASSENKQNLIGFGGLGKKLKQIMGDTL